MSNRGRRTWNRICSNMARPGDLSGDARIRRSREEIIVGIVTAECGVSSSIAADDFASDIILELWESKKFGDDFDAIREYVRGGIRKAIRKHELASRRFVDTVMTKDGPVPDRRVERDRHQRPMQELCIMAHEAVALAMALPKKQRDCLFILADGGNPIDVANDLGVAPWDAIRLIKEARDYVHRVDGLDEAA